MKYPPGLSEQEREDWFRYCEEFAAEAEEFEAEIETGRERLALVLDLLAWVIARGVEPLNLSLPGNWPKVNIPDDLLLRRLALRDQLLFDLARYQVAKGLRTDPERLGRFASQLLERDRPQKRTRFSDHLARDFLIVAACVVAESFGFWPDAVARPSARSQQRDTPGKIDFEAAGGFRYSSAGSAKVLFDLLNGHSRLEDLPDAVPSVDTIRAAILKREQVCGALGIAWKGADELLSDLVHGGMI